MSDWKEIPGYAGYFAHPDGLIMNSAGRILKGTLHQGLYYRINIANHKTKQFLHRLIAITFLPPVFGKTAVDHINRNKLDNRLENLRWASDLENGNNKPESKQIYWNSYHKGWHAQKTIMGKRYQSKVFKTAAEAEEWFNENVPNS